MAVSASPSLAGPSRGIAHRLARSLARAQQLIADMILPLPGGHPAATFRGRDPA